MKRILFLSTYDSDPYFNMAAEEYFFNLVENDSIYGVLRFFTWKPVSISLGYYQKIKYFDLDEIDKDGIKIVRRLTGGNAILHKNDFTYSLIIKNEMNDLLVKKDFYHYLANILKNSLTTLGVECNIKGDLEISEVNPDCFNSPSQYEIVDKNGNKLVGSAQKISKKCLLQHGSFFCNYDTQMIKKYFIYEGFKNSKTNSFYHNELIDVMTIEKAFYDSFKSQFELINYTLKEDDLLNIKNLSDIKYSKSEWN
ncbi:MAG TPA: biotin/lipoate A/B protein ligase family protein, partial [Spirochaetota bacterium]|nr:biotin/lipoate A/B protein ligase family protein [Spirochaetota bacterium]